MDESATSQPGILKNRHDHLVLAPFLEEQPRRPSWSSSQKCQLKTVNFAQLPAMRRIHGFPPLRNLRGKSLDSDLSRVRWHSSPREDTTHARSLGNVPSIVNDVGVCGRLALRHQQPSWGCMSGSSSLDVRREPSPDASLVDGISVSPSAEKLASQLATNGRPTTKTLQQVWDPCKAVKNESDRGALADPPKYSVGVLEENWQYRATENAKPCVEKFKGCSIYSTSYKAPPHEVYQTQSGFDMWGNRQQAEGVPTDLIFSAGEKECRNNFTTTTDLVYRIMPQICPKMREYNTNLFEWVPSQSFLPCYGNLTHFGLTEEKQREWGANTVSETKASYLTTMRDHFQWPHPAHLKVNRAKPRGVSCSEPTGEGGGARPPECWYCPKGIIPTLPTGPPIRLSVPPTTQDENKNEEKSRALRLFTTGFDSRPHLCRVPCT